MDEKNEFPVFTHLNVFGFDVGYKIYCNDYDEQWIKKYIKVGTDNMSRTYLEKKSIFIGKCEVVKIESFRQKNKIQIEYSYLNDDIVHKVRKWVNHINCTYPIPL